MRHAHTVGTATLIVLVGARTLSAADPQVPERVRIDYSAPIDCPDQKSFEDRISERIKGPWLARPDELARPVHVDVATLDGRWLARMSFTDPTGRPVSRVVTAPSCDEAMSGIALVTALAIESQVFGPMTSAATKPAPPPPSSQRAWLDKPPGPLPAKRRPAARAAPVLQEVGLRFGVVGPLGPSAGHGLGALWGMGTKERPAWLRAGFEGYRTGEVLVYGNVVAEFNLLLLRAELCPLRLFAKSPLSFPWCAGLEAGVVSGKGISGLVQPRRQSTPWAALALSPRARLADASLFAELVAELRAPLVRHEFRVGPNPGTTAYEIPPIVFALLGGFGLTVP